MKRKTINTEKIRRAVADYLSSEGCGCCRDTDAHEQHEKSIAEMLGVEKYDDGSGYDFSKYRTKS